MAWENYGTSYVIDQRIAINGTGANATIVAWDYEAWTPGLGGRPGYNNPGNVITETDFNYDGLGRRAQTVVSEPNTWLTSTPGGMWFATSVGMPMERR